MRGLLRQYLDVGGLTVAADPRDRAAWTALADIIAANEGPPQTGRRWNTGRHRTLSVLRARCRCAPGDVTQKEIDRISGEATVKDRRSLRKAVQFLNGLRDDLLEIPELAAHLPAERLHVPAGSSRARRIDWSTLPASFRAAFDAAASAAVAGEDDHGEALLARLEAGEDPEYVMAEADRSAAKMRSLRKPDAARTRYRETVSWLLRAWEDEGGDPAELRDLGELTTRTVIEAAIRSQIARSDAAPDLKNALDSDTLKLRLANLSAFARHGLNDRSVPAIVELLKSKHLDKPRARRRVARETGVVAEVDAIAALLHGSPAVAARWVRAPELIARSAEDAIRMARAAGSPSREVTALRQYGAAVAAAMQLSRPLRPSCLRLTRIASREEVPANLIRTPAPRKAPRFEFRYESWETKTERAVTLDVASRDAQILKTWLELHRPRFIELTGRGHDNVYLFPGEGCPRRDSGDPVRLPSGVYAPSSFLALWRAGASVVGLDVTPHRMRHVVAILVLALRPGAYGLVSTILCNTEEVARRHYGRDDGKAVSQALRDALLAHHPDLLRRHRWTAS
ncbi:hypothetical protein [Pontivivens ytuae]|uniref:hypothetical protein n=1 Tax=Pontivivens ytuae TaxID=2789856 RepID=UPI001E381900|nr:hypothetical protein [Pontivivens ytuae]